MLHLRPDGSYVCKTAPANIMMGNGLKWARTVRTVFKKHKRPGPPIFSDSRYWYVTAKIIVKFLINIHQGTEGYTISRLYGKTQSPSCLAVVVVRILSKDPRLFTICQWCKRKCALKNIIRRRKYLAGLIFVKYGII